MTLVHCIHTSYPQDYPKGHKVIRHMDWTCLHVLNLWQILFKSADLHKLLFQNHKQCSSAMESICTLQKDWEQRACLGVGESVCVFPRGPTEHGPVGAEKVSLWSTERSGTEGRESRLKPRGVEVFWTRSAIDPRKAYLNPTCVKRPTVWCKKTQR